MRYAIPVALACMCIALNADASQLFGAKGSFRSLSTWLEYDPARACYKPSRPFSTDRYSQDRYVASAREYLHCLRSAAEHDLEYSQQVVRKGYEKAHKEFLLELERDF